ncbi:succinate-semialdehyde dehydrogenase [Dipodascopsis tothii]|uniref:succinate-semialdehyde dehydrogenase n=1 Tax=Dipodascopsis tothii TaxID=44089 RepID=UPI0034CD7AC4
MIGFRYIRARLSRPGFPSGSYTHPARKMSSQLKDQTLFKEQAFIGGKFVDAASGATFVVTNPATGDKIGSAAEMDVGDLQRAIDTAAAAFKTFRKTSGRARARMIRAWYDLTVANTEDLGRLITLENGKTLAEAKGEVTYAASFMEWFSEEAPRVYGDVIPASNGVNRAFTVKQPVGVCGIITPWNFPAAMITRKVAAAVAAGCTVVVKPDAETPYTALALAELARRAGIPDGVINIVTTSKNLQTVGKELCSSPKIKKISFTGSTNVGKLLMDQASSTLKKCSFELGGNSPFIVFDDVDLDLAVEAAVLSKFRGTGQTCVCANRFFVHAAVYDAFAAKLTAAVAKFRIGNGFDAGVTHGPLIHGRALAKVQDHVDDATAKGATVTIGGAPAAALGANFFEPTVVTGVTQDMKIASEETFGPIAALFKFTTEDEVVELANSVEVGLASYLMTNDVSRVWRIAEGLEFGMVGVNTGAISDAATPFGGVKYSGFGREGSKYGIEEYVTIKSVTIGNIGL